MKDLFGLTTEDKTKSYCPLYLVYRVKPLLSFRLNSFFKFFSNRACINPNDMYIESSKKDNTNKTKDIQ